MCQYWTSRSPVRRLTAAHKGRVCVLQTACATWCCAHSCHKVWGWVWPHCHSHRGLRLDSYEWREAGISWNIRGLPLNNVTAYSRRAGPPGPCPDTHLWWSSPRKGTSWCRHVLFHKPPWRSCRRSQDWYQRNQGFATHCSCHEWSISTGRQPRKLFDSSCAALFYYQAKLRNFLQVHKSENKNTHK